MPTSEQQLRRMKLATLPDGDTQHIVLVKFDGAPNKAYSYYWAHPTKPTVGHQACVITPLNGPTNVTIVGTQAVTPLNVRKAKKYACLPKAYTGWKCVAYEQQLVASPKMEHVFYDAPQTTSGITNSTNTLINAQQEASTMNSPKIETITFVNGNNVNNMSDDQLITLLRDIDANIATLKELGELPKRLAKRLEQLEADRKALFDLLDRDDA